MPMSTRGQAPTRSQREQPAVDITDMELASDELPTEDVDVDVESGLEVEEGEEDEEGQGWGPCET